jgi:hypothetical protein
MGVAFGGIFEGGIYPRTGLALTYWEKGDLHRAGVQGRPPGEGVAPTGREHLCVTLGAAALQVEIERNVRRSALP